MIKNLIHKAIILLLAMTAATASVGQEKPYNVLFIAIDDLNDYVSLLEDYPGLKTPNLDKFAKTSINFKNAYCAAPVCNPSRTAILTGMSPVNTGVYENQDQFKDSEPAMNSTLLPEHFKNNGYRTMWSGKLYHTRPDKERVQAMWDDSEGQDGGYGPWPEKKMAKDVSRFFNYKVWEGPDEDFPDITNGDITINRLQQEYDKPFFMVYGLYRPHNPWTAPKRFFDMYPLEEVQLPEVLEDDLDDLGPIARKWADFPIKLDRVKELNQWKPVVRSYLASISFMDYSLGRVLDALEKSPHRDNTIVVLWSDHGFHMGEKNHFAKYALWEKTTHTLLMARIPGETNGGEVRDQPVNLVDLYPTLVDYCSLPSVEQKLDGTSLRQVIEDAGYEREQPSLTYYKKGSVGMRTKDWRYIRYYDGSEELYDRKKDPNEWYNLANDTAYKSIKESFYKWLPGNIVAGVGELQKQ
jgi:arylsulfatase A-like enzyme